MRRCLCILAGVTRFPPYPPGSAFLMSAEHTHLIAGVASRIICTNLRNLRLKTSSSAVKSFSTASARMRILEVGDILYSHLCELFSSAPLSGCSKFEVCGANPSHSPKLFPVRMGHLSGIAQNVFLCTPPGVQHIIGMRSIPIL